MPTASPRRVGPGALPLASAFCWAGFLVLAGLVRYSRTVGVDAAAERLAERLEPSWADRVGDILTEVGRVELTLAAAMAVAAVLWWRGRRLSAAALVLIWGTLVVEVVFKELLLVSMRDAAGALGPGPRGWPGGILRLLAEPGAAYPSGHMARAVFLGGLVGWAAVARCRAPVVRLATLGAIMLFLGLMGFTRITQNEHPLVDVVGGLLLGGAFLPPAWWLCARDRRRVRGSRSRRAEPTDIAPWGLELEARSSPGARR